MIGTKTALEKQMFVLQLIQERILISKDSNILIKFREFETPADSYVAFLSVLQKSGILNLTGVSEIKESQAPFFEATILNPFQSTRVTNFKDIEKNVFASHDVLEIKVLPGFYEYFLNFCKENGISENTADKKVSTIIEAKENEKIKKRAEEKEQIEKVKSKLVDKQVIWVCCLCKTRVPGLITSENIEGLLELFKKGKPKSCKNGHHNQFRIKNGEIQFLTDFMTLEKLEKEKFVEPLDSDALGD
jgi:ribosomal protein L9